MIYIIAKFMQRDGRIGYRLLDINTREMNDIPEQTIIQVLQSGKAKIENAEVIDGQLVGTNGSLDRFMPGNGLRPIVILNTISYSDLKPIGYTVVNYLGHIRNMTVSEAVAVGSMYGIQNGKIVEKDSTRYISSIKGNYPNIQKKDPPDPEVEKAERRGKRVSKVVILGYGEEGKNEVQRIYKGNIWIKKISDYLDCIIAIEDCTYVENGETKPFHKGDTIYAARCRYIAE